MLNINDVLRAQNTTYTYDHLNRLKTATLAGVYAHSWTYNSIGNMLTRNDNNGNVTYQYNDANHKHAVSQIGSQYFCYDANGNMTRRNATSSACTNGDALVYDKENKLTSITVGATTTTYLYDGDGNRVKKVAGGVTTYYVGNHYEVTIGVATKYYYFGKQRVAMRVGANTRLYLHSDHLGSTSATTNSAGTSTSSQLYYAFGGIRSGSAPTDFGFTGQRKDASANLMYYNARYYDTTLGRFVSADSLVPDRKNPQSLNRYSYVYNNPLKYNDPSGHCPNPDLPSDYDGSVLCLDWFISTEYILENRWETLRGLLRGHGDGRGFSTDSDPTKSRVFLYIYLLKDGTIDPKRSPEMYVNRSCIEGAGCFGPIMDRNIITISQDAKTKEISIGWSLANGFGGTLLDAAEESEEIADGLAGSPFAGIRGLLGIGQRFGGEQLNPIDGTMKLTPQPTGYFEVTGGARDPYPSLEVYRYFPNKVLTIWQSPEQYGPDNGPMYGLTDQAPRDT